jgi:predicted O-methyltransferase YrrM
MRGEVRELAREVKGFLEEAEGLCLFELARESASRGPCLEIGSYCGKSTLYLAEGCRTAGEHPLFCIDHHHGSEEQQPRQPYFDPELYNEELAQVDTLPCFRRNVTRAGLEKWVIPILGYSRQIGRYWSGPSFSLVFIDGGHSEEDVFGDYHTWSPHIMVGGYLCIHDIFPDPADGGQAPYHLLEQARAGGRWEYVEQVKTLGILRRHEHERDSRHPLHALLRKLSPHQ